MSFSRPAKALLIPTARDLGAELAALIDQRIASHLDLKMEVLKIEVQKQAVIACRDRDRPMTVNEVARRFRHNDKIVNDDVRSGRLPSTTVKSKRSPTGFEYRIKSSDAEKWHEERFEQKRAG